MIPADSRMRAAAEFNAAMRGGSKAARATVVVYVAPGNGTTRRVGFAVSKAVGGAVVRNKVRRRLRAILAEALPEIPRGSGVVVRALPSASAASFADLRGDVLAAIGAAVSRGSR